MSIEVFLPSLIEPSKFANLSDFVDYTYVIFADIFNKPTIKFNEKYVLARPKILDCSNCANKCNNLFTCNICPFKGKVDIFQHVCSDEDYNLKVLPGYKNTRTPGIFNKTRTSRVAWLKFMIENYDNIDFVRYYNFPASKSNREINHYFWLYNAHYILILVEEKNSNKIYIRSCYDIKSDKDEKRHFNQYQKYAKN